MSADPRETLETMLSLLGFFCEIEETQTPSGGVILHVQTAEKERLIGRNGQVLDDIQALLNRMLQAKAKGAPKVQVDIEHYRAMQEDKLVCRVRELAVTVRQTGRPLQLEPMNGYDRRIVHNAFIDDPEICTWSPPDDARVKRITLKLRA
ncbi:MAG: R3H domain-containing nucleic acid-binding protein [Verrucomicrobiota bacterium]